MFWQAGELTAKRLPNVTDFAPSWQQTESATNTATVNIRLRLWSCPQWPRQCQAKIFRGWPLPLPPFPLEVGPLNTARGSGERCKLPQRFCGAVLWNFVDFSLKIWYLVASHLLIFLRINWRQCVKSAAKFGGLATIWGDCPPPTPARNHHCKHALMPLTKLRSPNGGLSDSQTTHCYQTNQQRRNLISLADRKSANSIDTPSI